MLSEFFGFSGTHCFSFDPNKFGRDCKVTYEFFFFFIVCYPKNKVGFRKSSFRKLYGLIF